MSGTKYRAYDTGTQWLGRVRKTIAEAEADARWSNADYAAAGGYGSAIVVTEDSGRCRDLCGEWVWPPHGRGCGAVRWR
jgi:hypothetical protein